MAINIDMAVSGARECQTQINAAATSVKQMQSALKLANSEFKLTGDATAMYTSKVQTLQAQINAQTQAVEAAQRGLQTMADAYGENSTQAAAWQAKVNTAQTALNNMQASLNEMTGKLAESSAAMSSTAGAAGSLAGALSGMAGGSYSMDGLNSSLAGSQTEIQKTSDQLAQLQDQVKETGGLFYNVGNMSISAANGGKVASAISSIAKGMESVVKSSSETAAHTDDLGSIILGGMSGGSMSAGGVMSTVGGVVSNFGPWGAVAGAVLNLGGSIADAVSEGIERREKAKREAEYNAYWKTGLDKAAMESLAHAMSKRDEIVAKIENDVKATVTANVGDLRVVIEQATEDGHVDRREVGAVKEYVEKVLMADYDDAVFELMRMRGELWVLATQGYTPEEVAMYGDMSKPENSALYTFIKGFLGDDPNSYIQQFFDNDEQVQNAATNLWLFMAKKFGSADAMVEAFKDPEQKDVVQGFISEWLQATFGSKGLSLSKANLTAANLMTRLWSLIDMDFAGSNADKSGGWFENTEGGGLFVQWMQSILTEGDKQDALDYARDMWIDVIAAATDPEAAVQTLHDTSGADAAADYRAGKKTNAAAQFGTMVDWVMKTLKISDKNRAIEIAIEMWDQVRHAASYGVSGTGTLTLDTSWITGTKAGTVFQDWVAANLTDGDKEEAERTAKKMWAAVVAAASSPEAAVGAIYSATGEEAAAAAKANPDSSTGKTFNAFLAWVNENYPELDADDAEKEAIRLWNAVRTAASYGSTTASPLTPDTSWITNTKAGTVFQDWVAANLTDGDKKDAEDKAKSMWASVVAACSSPESAINAIGEATGEEAAAEAKANPSSAVGETFNAFLAWVKKNYPDEDATAAEQKAIQLWNAVRLAAATGSKDGRAGTVLTLDTSWILTTAAGTAFTDWVKKVLPEEDKKDAVGYAQRLWGEVIAAASSPEAAIGALSSATGEEAAAAYEAGEDSDTSKGFGVMVKWCEDVLGDDHDTAVKNAINMWDTLRTAAFSGIDESGTNHTTTKTGSYTFSGSEAMRTYIAKVMGTDFEAAISSANDYWDRLIKAVKGDTAQTDGKDLRSDLLKQALEEYKKTLDEIKKVTEEMENAQGDDLDAKIAYLEELLNRAETLGKRIERLTGKEMARAEGAYNLITYGGSEVKYNQSDIDSAFAYLAELKTMADSDYANAVAEAEAKRREVWGSDTATDEDKAKAEAEYADTIKKANADHAKQIQTYTSMLGDFVDVLMTDRHMDNNPTGARNYVLELLTQGVFSSAGMPSSKATDKQKKAWLEMVFGDDQNPLFVTLADLYASATGSLDVNGETKNFRGIMELLQFYRLNGVKDFSNITIGGKKFDSFDDMPWLNFFTGFGSMLDYTKSDDFNDVFGYYLWYAHPELRQSIPNPNEGGGGSGTKGRKKRNRMPRGGNRSSTGGSGTGGSSGDGDRPNVDGIIADMGEAGTEAGENLDSSLAAAINQNAGTPEGAAGAMAARVAQAVRDSLGIASPSKVMLAYGAYTAMGLAEGIDASMAMVTRASRRMASAVVSPMSDAAASAGRTVNNSATSSLYIDKYYQRSDADVDSLAAAIADKNRLGRYGNGLRN